MNDTQKLLDDMRALEHVSEDRFYRFWFDYKNATPEHHESSLKRIYLYSIFVSALSTVFFLWGFYLTFSANINQRVDVVRVDGVIVDEFFDLRRDVLIQNVKQRVEIRDEEAQGGRRAQQK